MDRSSGCPTGRTFTPPAICDWCSTTAQVLVPTALAATELDEDDRGLTGLAVASDPPTGPERIWAVSTTHDGLPSALGGPWRMSAPYPGLAMAELAASALPDVVRLSWTWPTSATRAVVVESSDDAGPWTRVSAPVPTSRTTFELARETGPRRYRLRSASTTSNEVAIP